MNFTKKLGHSFSIIESNGLTLLAFTFIIKFLFVFQIFLFVIIVLIIIKLLIIIGNICGEENLFLAFFPLNFMLIFCFLQEHFQLIVSFH